MPSRVGVLTLVLVLLAVVALAPLARR